MIDISNLGLNLRMKGEMMNSFFDWVLEYNDLIVNTLLLSLIPIFIILGINVYKLAKKARGRSWWL